MRKKLIIKVSDPDFIIPDEHNWTYFSDVVSNNMGTALPYLDLSERS